MDSTQNTTENTNEQADVVEGKSEVQTETDVKDEEKASEEVEGSKDSANTTEVDSKPVEETPAKTPKESILTRTIPTHFTPSLAVLTVINTVTALVLLIYQLFLPGVLPFPERLWGAIVLLICSGAILAIAVRRSRELSLEKAKQEKEAEEDRQKAQEAVTNIAAENIVENIE